MIVKGLNLKKMKQQMNERSRGTQRRTIFLLVWINLIKGSYVLYLVKCRTASPTCEVTWESWISTNREKQRVNNVEKHQF